jgi:Rrf2 family iron-sulfur cluster assembly transcriptional regulator
MMDLALHARIHNVSLAEIAERQKISQQYLEQLFGSLRKAQLVTSVRGPKGGYSLAKDTTDISLADILVAVGENINLSCGAGKSCNDIDPCLTHGLWNNLSAEFYNFFASKKLSDLVKSRDVQTLATAQDISLVGDIPIMIKS